jgi:hypothetical protein
MDIRADLSPVKAGDGRIIAPPEAPVALDWREWEVCE